MKSCCRSFPDRIGFVDRADVPMPGGGALVRDAVETDFVPDPVTAYHEAGHAVVGVLFGMTPVEIVAGSAGFVRWRDNPIPQEAGLVMTMAGDFAGGLAVRVEYRPFDSELAPWLELIRKPAGGYCDRCRIIRQLVVDAGIDAPDVTILSAYRAGEVRTLEILRRNDVRAAIRAVANALMKTGRLTGEEATEIAARYVQPGELKQEI